jgi:hypothetical protein
MTHQFQITVLNEAVGIPSDQDGIMGLIVQGVAVGGSLALDTPYLLTSTTDAAALGINAAYDVTNSTAVFQQINEFYAQAGVGAYLWLQVCAMNTTYATYVGTNAFKNFVRFTAQADPTMQAKIIGLCYAPPTATQSGSDFPADVTATLTAGQTIQQSMFLLGYPFALIVDGYNMSSTVTPGTIGTQATNSAFAVSLCITGTKGNGVSAVGLALGKYSRISIGRGVGAVVDGALNTSTAFLTNGITIPATGTLVVGNTYLVQGGAITYNALPYAVGSTFTAVLGETTFSTTAGGYVVYNSTPIGNIVGGSVVGLDETSLNTLGEKQFFFITTVQNISGLFWNDGATCTASTNFFCSMEYNRVMNSLAYDARAYFGLLRGLNLPSDTTTGALDPSFCLTKAASFKKTYITPLTAASGSGDISGGSISITGPTYAADGNVNFALSLVRATIVGNITGTAQFVLTLNS